MRDINDASDDIYEALMDRDIESISKKVKDLRGLLDDILAQL